MPACLEVVKRGVCAAGVVESPGLRRFRGPVQLAGRETNPQDFVPEGTCSRMNRIFSVVRSMTEKSIELSRGVVRAPAYGESKGAVGVDRVNAVMLTNREGERTGASR